MGWKKRTRWESAAWQGSSLGQGLDQTRLLGKKGESNEEEAGRGHSWELDAERVEA